MNDTYALEFMEPGGSATKKIFILITVPPSEMQFLYQVSVAINLLAI